VWFSSGRPAPNNDEEQHVDLSISSDDRDDVTIVHVGGEIDVYTAPVLRERLDEHISEGRHHLVVDLEDVSFMDSTGLGVLVGRLKLVRVSNGTLQLVCSSERILKVFSITGLDKVFQIFASVDDALAAPA
jgi:anti-sigma B factor antagonist